MKRADMTTDRVITALAYVVAGGLIILGFLGGLLIVSDTDAAFTPDLSTSEFIVKKLAGVALLGASIYTWRAIERHGK